MKIFKELKKLGYKHYTEHTIEELDNLLLTSKERIMEQSLVFKFFREKYKLHSYIDITIEDTWYFSIFNLNTKRNSEVHIKESYFETFEEAELECLVKLIDIVKTK
jgi:predicted GNAT superfamily acetyltransferase